MFSELSVAYVDVRPGDLRWALDLGHLDALVSMPVTSGDLNVELRILGTSHQVIVSGPDGMRISETVACGLEGEPLPGNVNRDHAGLGYEFASTVEQLRPGALERRVRELVDALYERPDALVGAFPDDPLAVTALSVGSAEHVIRDRIGWSSWHCYPQTGHLVSTHTSLRMSLHTMDTVESARAGL